MHAELLILRLIHILGGMLWIGSGILVSFFLAPAIAQAGPSGGQVMANLAKRKLFLILPINGVVTILSGARLMQIVSGGFAASYFATGPGRAYSISAGFAILSFLIGILISRPSAMKLAKLSNSAVSDQTSKQLIQGEIRTLQKRVMMSSTVALALALVAAAGMAVARYM